MKFPHYKLLRRLANPQALYQSTASAVPWSFYVLSREAALYHSPGQPAWVKGTVPPVQLKP